MLAVIGNLQGLSVRIKVDELTVNQIHPGQKVKVTGIAFPEHTLLGVIKKVERQGESAGGGVPTFAAEIIVPQLTEAEQHVIHVGMSANVEINTETSAQIIVPLTAISEKEGISYIKRYDEKSKQPIDVAVKTGQTTLDSVAILSNLKSGDKIVIPN
jgi:HlyD family secretion protein